MEIFDTFFWVMCGLWVGLGGAAIGKARSGRLLEAAVASKDEISRFLRGYAAAIMIPCVLLWLIQMISGKQMSPDFNNWPHPFDVLALTITVCCWVALFLWVQMYGGAKTLARFSPLISTVPFSELGARVFVSIILFGGVLSLWNSHV